MKVSDTDVYYENNEMYE